MEDTEAVEGSRYMTELMEYADKCASVLEVYLKNASSEAEEKVLTSLIKQLPKCPWE